MKIVKIISLSLFMASLLSLIIQPDPLSLESKFIKTADGGRLTLETTKYYEKRATEILLTKTNAEGNEEWYKFYGGRSYDKASDFIQTLDGGYAILGSTSSYGKGNYDVYLIKVDSQGKEEWSKTYGGFYNEYGHTISQSSSGNYKLTGTRQSCYGDNATPNCDDEKWFVSTDNKGNQIWSGVPQK
jgi:hypothetical protein